MAATLPARPTDHPTEAERTDDHLRTLKRRAYIGIVLLAAAAVWLAYQLDSTDTRTLVPPATAVALLAAAVALSLRPAWLRRIEILLFVLSGVAILVDTATRLHSGAGSASWDALHNLVLWSPVACVWAFLVFGSRRGLIASLALYGVSAATVGSVRLLGSNALSGPELMVLGEVYLMGGVLLAMLFLVAHVTERHAHAQGEAEVLASLAYRDAVTGLANRLRFDERLERALEQRDTAAFAVLYIDLDDFKLVNDRHGHAAGDELLQQFGDRLAGALRAEDTVARLGGDEFAVLALGTKDDAAAHEVARKVLRAFEAPFPLGETTLTVTGSVGVALYPGDDAEGEGLQQKADMAMYRAKELGKNRYAFYSRVREGAGDRRFDLAAQLRGARQRGELAVHYQPLHDLASGELTGVEALLRWDHPERGDVPPEEFIPLAEAGGMMVELGDWVLDRACRQAAAWGDAGRPVRVSVNVSAVQLAERDFTTRVDDALRRSGLDPHRLELDVTERAAMQPGTRETLRALRRRGVRVALDDFGSGYSSLGQLQGLPVDTFKIDRAFVQAIQSPREATKSALALLQTIVGLAEGLELDVIAEGVESEQQAEALRRTGCAVAQGFFFSEALPPERIAPLLAPRGTPRADPPAAPAPERPRAPEAPPKGVVSPPEIAPRTAGSPRIDAKP